MAPVSPAVCISTLPPPHGRSESGLRAGGCQPEKPVAPPALAVESVGGAEGNPAEGVIVLAGKWGAHGDTPGHCQV